MAARVLQQPFLGEQEYGNFGKLADLTSSANVEIIVGTGCTLSTDTSVTYNGQPTTKLTVAAGAAANLDIGVSTATLAFTDEHRRINRYGPLVIYKSDLATTGFDLFIGNDNTYSPNLKASCSANYTDANGWVHVISRGTDASAITVTGAMGLIGTKIWKLRFKRSGAGAGTIWFANCSVAPWTRPKVIITLDDAWAEHYTYVYPTALARNLPVSFSVRQDTIGTTNYATAAQMQEIANDSSGLFECTNHANTGTALSSLGLDPYITAVEQCRDYLTDTLDLDEYAANIHVWVQGSYTNAAIDSLISRGFHCAREVGASNRSWNPIHIAHDGTGRAQFLLPASCNLGTAQTLATVKGYINTAIGRGGTFVIMGHQFGASDGAQQWINDSSATYGFTALLDWLADRRDAGLIDVVKFSDWHKGLLTGRRILV